MKRFLQWWKGQPVLGISLLAALVSMCFVPPDAGYLSYCNRAVLIQLFCLMLTVAGLRSIGVFEQVTQNLLKRAGTVRRVGMFLVQLCFFSAMLVTNDVALLTFVPLTLLLFQEIGDEKSRIWVIVLETAAANLGSMMTPVGNPQNLYLYAAYQLHTADFFRTMLPAGVLSWLILLGLSFLLPKTPCAFLGELSLQGELRPVSGVLPMALAAKDCGVKIATENMWNWDDAKDESCFAACATSESFIEHIDAVNDPYLVACLDIGHAEMRGSGSGAANMIRALGHRLQALHIHDNDRWHDSHQIPFSMSIDFAPIAAALKEIGYKGWFTLEADHYLKEKFNAENVFEGMKDLHTAAVRFEKLFDEA